MAIVDRLDLVELPSGKVVLNIYSPLKKHPVVHLVVKTGHDPDHRKMIHDKRKADLKAAEEMERAKEFNKNLRIEREKHKGELSKAMAEAGVRVEEKAIDKVKTKLGFGPDGKK